MTLSGTRIVGRLVLSSDAADCINTHLAASEPEEEGCFLLTRAVDGLEGLRLVGHEVLLPQPGDWESRGRDNLRPSGQWLSRAVSAASRACSGLLFVHSHPGSKHPPSLSRIDRASSIAFARAMAPVVDGPIAFGVVQGSRWAVELWDGDDLVHIPAVWASGRTLRRLSPESAQDPDPLDDRQRDALGAAHDVLRDICVGVVGLGGTGSPLAEVLVRMGVGRLILIDHDELDTPSNLRRVFGSTRAHLVPGAPSSKVQVVAQHLDNLGLDCKLTPLAIDVRAPQALHALIDCDVIFGATDNHTSRGVLNDLAASALLPFIDVGAAAGRDTSGNLASLAADLRVVTPSTPCLWCLGAINADAIREESLPAEERRKLAAEGYLRGSRLGPAPSVLALNALAASLAACALLALISARGAAVVPAAAIDGYNLMLIENALTQPRPDCRCRQLLGRGLSIPVGNPLACQATN